MKLLVSSGIPLPSHLHLICEGMAFGIPLVGRSIIASEMKVVAEAEGIQSLEGSQALRVVTQPWNSLYRIIHRARCAEAEGWSPSKACTGLKPPPTNDPTMD